MRARTNKSVKHCVVVPVYNHGLTVAEVVRGAAQHLPVIAVDDGSTDRTPAALASLAEEVPFEILTLPRNQGKASAMRTAFARAGAQGYTHAITIDADGQHPTGAIPMLAHASGEQPDALIIGVRDLRTAKAPRERRFSNALSNFWFRMETGVPLADTQTGLRCYPLETVKRLRVKSSRYAWELEILVRAAWTDVPLVGRPVAVDYSAPTSQLSHFNPVRDFLRITRLHAWLLLQALVLPRSVRARRALESKGDPPQ
jgi:glycosyltransferase involved in cell wall biosynthesis